MQVDDEARGRESQASTADPIGHITAAITAFEEMSEVRLGEADPVITDRRWRTSIMQVKVDVTLGELPQLSEG